MMKTNGPSHAVGYKSAKKQGWFLEGKQCVCADVISVYEIIKPTAPSPLTRPASLEMLKNSRVQKSQPLRSIGDPGRDITVRDTPRTDPDGRSLAHPVLISDEWRRRVHQERGGAHAVEEAIAEPKRECVSKRSGLSGSGDE